MTGLGLILGAEIAPGLHAAGVRSVCPLGVRIRVFRDPGEFPETTPVVSPRPVADTTGDDRGSLESPGRQAGAPDGGRRLRVQQLHALSAEANALRQCPSPVFSGYDRPGWGPLGGVGLG